MSDKAIYKTDITQGFLNGELDRVQLSEQDIIQKTYGSNCSFLGLNKAIVPRVLTSICRPLFLTDDYEIMMYAAERTNVLAAMKRKDINYTFYLPRDEGIGTGGDSSLIRVVTNPDLDRYHFEAWNRSLEQMERVDTRDLRNKILHQITVSSPQGIADKEFLRNLGGKYIIVNNKNGTVSGTDRTTFGYFGDSTITLKPERIDMQMDNGEVYALDSWFNFSGSNYQGLFASKYPGFLDLLTKAGLYDPVLYEFPFLVDGENYTVFIPSMQALNDYGVNEMSKEELNQFLRYHFVREDLIFTDGRKPEGNYSTTCIEESSTSYRTHFSQIYIRPTPDIIQILDKNGDVYLNVPEQEGETNQIIWYDTNDQSSSDWDFITTGVIHNINKVLIRDSLQSK